MYGMFETYVTHGQHDRDAPEREYVTYRAVSDHRHGTLATMARRTIRAVGALVHLQSRGTVVRREAGANGTQDRLAPGRADT
jgi:hypothetical protein